MPKFNLSPYMINGYDNNLELLAIVKQSQTKPILSRQKDSQTQAKPTCGELVEPAKPIYDDCCERPKFCKIFFDILYMGFTIWKSARCGVDLTN
jgi:hypothetical protein